MRRRVKRWWSMVLGLIVLLAGRSAAQQASEWELNDFRSTISVADDGSAVILERMALTFLRPARGFHGLRRIIPVESAGLWGSKRRLFLRGVQVSDDNGNPLDHTVRTWGGKMEIQVPLTGHPNELRIVQIRYLVHNAVRYNPDHDEVYWNATSSTLEMTAQRASVTVLLPENAGDEVRGQAFVGGSAGKTVAGDVQRGGVDFIAPGAVTAYQPFAVWVVVPKGAFREPWPWSRASWFVESNPIVLMPVAVFVLMLRIRKMKGQLPPVAVVTEYEPPKGLTPAEAGTLLTDRVEPRDITATLVDLAVRGYIKMEEDHSEGHQDYIIRLMKPREAWHELSNYEIDMLFNTFYGGQWTKLSSLKLRFVVTVPAMRAGILNALIDKGMYRADPAMAHLYRVVAVAAAGLLFLAAQLAGWIALFDSGALAIAVVGASAGIVYAMGRKLTAKSAKGMQACAEVEGFREFMERVDADRLKRVSPDKFERCLPYAIALGVEHNWAEQLAGITQESPDWLVVAAGEGFDISQWTRSLGTMSQEAQSVFTAKSRSGRAPQSPVASLQSPAKP